MVTVHPDILDEPQRQVLRRIAGLADREGFYLGGGTAIAMQLGHRMSDDFDWFRDDSFDPLALAHELQQGEPFRTTMTAKDTLWGTVDGVKTSFFRFAYPLLEERLEADGFAVHLASLADLACMKLNAVSQRGSKRDFVDIYFLMQRFSLAEMLTFYERRFHIPGGGHVLYSLTYFVDAEGDPMPRMRTAVEWDAVKAAVADAAVKLH